MNLSISNIAWTSNEDEEVYDIMQKYDIRGLEVAPTRLFDKPFEASNEDINYVVKHLKAKNICIVGMQSLLFGRPDLKIFKSEQKRNETLEYLKKNIVFGSKLGAKILVFGSPKNRFIDEIDYKAAYEIAEKFFYELGSFANNYNIKFCIEANPKQYGCNFITSTEEAFEFVKKVDNKGFGLHIDTGTIIMNDEDYSNVLNKVFSLIEYVHISEPNLILPCTLDKHKGISDKLKNLNYNGWVSIEMKNGLQKNNLKSVKQTFEFVKKIYFN